MNIIQEMKKLPKASIMALYNPKKGLVHLLLCRDGLKSVTRTLSEIREGTYRFKELIEDQDDLELIVLEELNDYSTLRLHMNYWFQYIKKLGLNLYTKKHNYLQYKARINVSLDLEGDNVVFVELVNRRNEAYVVGVFKNMADAKAFKSFYFDNQRYVYPVYSTNLETQKYIRKDSEQLNKIFKIRF